MRDIACAGFIALPASSTSGMHHRGDPRWRNSFCVCGFRRHERIACDTSREGTKLLRWHCRGCTLFWCQDLRECSSCRHIFEPARPAQEPRDKTGDVLTSERRLNMRYSSLTERIGGEGARAWEIHYRATTRVRGGESVILLSIGDPDFDTPPRVVDSCVENLRAGNTHYTAISGEPGLRAAIARHHAKVTGTPCTPDRVVVFHGAQNALYSAAICLLDRGDDIIVPEPMYVTYEAVVGASGARMVSVPCPREANFHLDLDALAAAVTPQTRAILLNTPNNPTGTVLTSEELVTVAELCRRHDLWLISDEVYATLTFERAHISPCALPGMAERTVTVNSLSKSHAMTGWRVGWTVSPPGLTPHLENLALCMHYGCPGFIQHAAAAALDDEPPEVAAMKAELRARRDLVCDRLAGVAGLECLKPDAGMFIMLDVRQTGIAAFEFASGLLESHAVSLLPADAFGHSARGHLRIGLCSSQDVLAEACDRIVRHTETVMLR